MNKPLQVTKSFNLAELVSPEYYNMFGDKSLQFLQVPAIMFLQKFRDYVGRPVLVNNWIDGGNLQYGGLRPFNCKTGASLSIHKFGGAFDPKVEGMTGAEMRQIIIDKWDTHFKGTITTIEDGTEGWLHGDCRNTGSDKLLIIPYWKKPK